MISDAADFLRTRLDARPEVLLVLGSGLGRLTERVDGGVEVPFETIPGFPPASVAGHRGRFVSGRLRGRTVLIQAGRYHYYEGHPPTVVAAPVQVAAALGVGTVILTNAAGGIHRRLRPGAVMLVTDHLNLQWRSPLAGPMGDQDARFQDMSAPYDPGLQAIAREAAASLKMELFQGTYAGVLGPSYETPAEIRALAAVGGDAVGMSTVPEVLAARARGLQVLAFSLITNRAAGLSDEPLSHEEVLEAGRRGSGGMVTLIEGVLNRMARIPERS